MSNELTPSTAPGLVPRAMAAQLCRARYSGTTLKTHTTSLRPDPGATTNFDNHADHRVAQGLLGPVREGPLTSAVADVGHSRGSRYDARGFSESSAVRAEPCRAALSIRWRRAGGSVCS